MALKFKGSWRIYQKRVLDELDFHLTDSKLHIVAAPGAGKTTLGIEVLARLNQPSLILCPTNTIKNQWKERICSSFLNEDEFNLVSTDIKNPKFITIITYQALFAAFTKSENDEIEEITDEEQDDVDTKRKFNPEVADQVIEVLKNARISVLCFDEAHHLRKEWWKVLTYLTENLNPKQTLALTATPPYDVDYSEWERYEAICGPIDAIISIPELVKNNDLCPHQDYIYFSSLKSKEAYAVQDYYNKVIRFMAIVKNDSSLISYLGALDIWNMSDACVEKVLDNPEFYVSVASLLKSSNIAVSKRFLDLFGAKYSELPSFDVKQAKCFLNGFLVTLASEFPEVKDKIESYYNLAKRFGLVQKKKVVLEDSAKIQKQIANSLGKLDSIVDIVKSEYASLNSDLRMVILTDYIRAEDVDNSHLGVVPIWRVLNDKFGLTIPIGILSGSVIVLPKSTLDCFYKLLEQKDIDVDSVNIQVYGEDADYIKIIPNNSAKYKIVSLITEMFTLGEVQVLVGTQALLGEGWDAPCINSLILSSTVSSYMLSNQMRGRAIRKDKNNPNKVSNIWHLATIGKPSTSSFFNIFDDPYSDSSCFYDINQLAKRFEGFEAPSFFGKHEIMSGISRVIDFNMLKSLCEYDTLLSGLNSSTLKIAGNRAEIKKWWDNALYLGYSGGEMRLRNGLVVPKVTSKTLCYKGYKQIFGSMIFLILYILGQFCSYPLYKYFIWFVVISLGCLGWVGYNYLRTGSIAGVLKQVAIVHLEVLEYLGLIKTSLQNVKIQADNLGYITCCNLAPEENNVVISALQEFLGPIKNPRYLLIRKGNFPGQCDYFAIPSVIATSRKNVDIFEKLWNKYIGNGKIVYTRNVEGRKLLLKARKVAFSAMQRERTEKLSKWQ